jgi:hypothetical protein
VPRALTSAAVVDLDLNGVLCEREIFLWVDEEIEMQSPFM